MNRICLNPYSITVSESPSADRLSVLWILRRRSRLWRARNLHTQLRLIFRCRHSWIRWAAVRLAPLWISARQLWPRVMRSDQRKGTPQREPQTNSQRVRQLGKRTFLLTNLYINVWFHPRRIHLLRNIYRYFILVDYFKSRLIIYL